MQMYKVFINDKPILIVNTIQTEHIASDHLVYQYQSKKGLLAVIAEYQQSNTYNKLILYDKNTNVLFKKLISLYKTIKAAGGVVRNLKGNILFIYRLGKWDLPKGKIEKNEKIKDTAIREVEEECGISKLTIIKSLPSTYHIYNLKGKNVLKKTYWYEMKCKDSKTPVPQIKEDITAVRWIDNETIEDVLQNAYLSIKELIIKYLDIK